LYFTLAAVKTKEWRTRRVEHDAALTLSPLEPDLSALALTLTVCVPIMTTTMTPAMPPRVATIRITAAVHPIAIAVLAAIHPVVIAILAAFPPVAIIVLSGSAGYCQAADTENQHQTKNYHSL
jgi:hypothetical protein